MIRRYIALLRLLFVGVDGLGAVILFVAITMARYGSTDWLAPWSAAGLHGGLVAVIYAIGWVAATWLLGLYRLRIRWSFRSELSDIVRADIFVAVATFAALYVLKLPGVSRLFLIELLLAQIIVAVTIRFLLRLAFAWLRANGRNTRFVLVVGTGKPAEAFADRLERHSELGLAVIGHLAVPGDTVVPRRPVLGMVDEIETILHGTIVDEVAICLPATEIGLIEPIARLCEEEGRIVRIPLGEVAFSLPGGRVEELDGLSILSLVYGPERTLSLLVKRALDLVVAALALIVLSPLFLVVASWMRIADGTPVMFNQIRVGVHGRLFRIYKFRTMVPDAEARYAEVVAMSDTKGAAFKMKDDPRVTKIGSILRRSSIDELPQLWNVMRGEMSIVGPRPAPPREVAEYDIWHRRRLSMKPGITGLWQVESRFDEEFDQRATLDLDYIDRWSLLLDLKIIVRTVPAMLQGR